MAKNQAQNRVERAEHLKVIQVNPETFYVESSAGKICYRVILTDDLMECTCGDFVKNSKTDPSFKCKHILAVFNSVPTGEVGAANILEKKKPKLKEQFLSNIKGRDFVLYAGLLDMAHQKGLLKIVVKALQFPTKENGNEAICQATAVSKLGEEFTEWGDANPKNVTPMIASHILRMAATRAKARALRDMTNVGITCLEELGNLDDVIDDNTPKTRQSPTQKKTLAKPKAVEKKPAEKAKSATGENSKPVTSTPNQTQPKKEASQKSGSKKDDTPAKMSEAQKRAIYNLARRRGISEDELGKMVEDQFGVSSIENLPPSDAGSFIRQLQQQQAA